MTDPTGSLYGRGLRNGLPSIVAIVPVTPSWSSSRLRVLRFLPQVAAARVSIALSLVFADHLDLLLAAPDATIPTSRQSAGKSRGVHDGHARRHDLSCNAQGRRLDLWRCRRA